MSIDEHEDTKKQITEILKQLHYEINFASKSLGIKTSEFNNNLEGTITKLSALLKQFNESGTQIQDQNTRMSEELMTFALLPEKITNSINDIAPQIAINVEKIHSSSILEITGKLSDIGNRLNDNISDYERKVAHLTDQSSVSLSASVEKFNSLIVQKLNEFTNKIAVTANLVSNQHNARFLKSLCFIILFSAIISGITSYFVTTQFPRYVEVKGVNDLTVHNSNVQVWGAKVPNKKETAKND